MKKNVSILIIFFFTIFYYSCILVPKSLVKIDIGKPGFKLIEIEEDNKQDNSNKEPRLLEIKEGEMYGGFMAGYVTWAKSGNPRVIKDRYNNLIEDLKELRYSYIFSPIQFKNKKGYVINDNDYAIMFNKVPIAKVIAFESTRNFEKKYEVIKLNLISAGSNIDFEYYRSGFASINLKEKSQEPGYENSYNFGVFNDDLTNSFKHLYNNGDWKYMLANITIKNKNTNKEKVYKIALNPKLFNDTIKLIFAKYPNLSEEKLKIPIK